MQAFLFNDLWPTTLKLSITEEKEFVARCSAAEKAKNVSKKWFAI